ncbi:hypothetical protein EV141_0298 [Microcella putealis]|uniref:Uncharacterized protein n=1 Tax=Microcella putealis TaxID=337005 RepID=A0A4Q7LWK7_9MICO|nr:hypothetical protein [Microcella putealis]RZS59081.1 hypothetical protein EV141_0298 [Microcella putealis]TQM24107.1 hypothetical protein BJ957_1577 [Microcella putealis]
MTALLFPRTAPTARTVRRRIGVAGILPVAALLVIAGCASPESTSNTDDDAPATDTSTDVGTGAGAGEDTPAEEPETEEGEAVIEGAELVTDDFVLATTLDEAAEIGNCQIAYGVLDASGVDITIVDDDSTIDCTALIEG